MFWKLTSVWHVWFARDLCVTRCTILLVQKGTVNLLLPGTQGY